MKLLRLHNSYIVDTVGIADFQYLNNLIVTFSVFPDALFGNCQRILEPKDQFQYNLDRVTLEELEKEIVQLLEEGYTWHDVYTQCKLGNVLLAFRKGVSFDPYWCEKMAEEDMVSNELNRETAQVLEQFFRNYYEGQMQDTLDASPEKKDQFVQVLILIHA